MFLQRLIVYYIRYVCVEKPANYNIYLGRPVLSDISALNPIIVHLTVEEK
jgi:hypothetical protein